MTTEAETIAKLAAGGAPRILAARDGREFIVRPDDMVADEVTDETRTVLPPGHVRQEVTLQTVDALADYVNAFKTSATTMFADITLNSIAALIDYHAVSDGKAPGAPDHLFHRATLTLPFSEEWRIWTAIHGKMMGQLEFARFLEENAADVAAPSGAELLEIVHDLHAIRKVNFKKAVRTATDHENFEYAEETSASAKNGAVEIPTKFLLQLPVYFGGATTELYAFLRWKLDDGTLHLGVALHRAEHVRQAVFKQIVLEVAGATERRALFGRLA